MHLQLAFSSCAAYNNPIKFRFSNERMMEMTPYSCMSKEQLESEYAKVLAQYEHCKDQKLNLNMARGKPAKKQLDLVSDILTAVLMPATTVSWPDFPLPKLSGQISWNASRKMFLLAAQRL